MQKALKCSWTYAKSSKSSEAIWSDRCSEYNFRTLQPGPLAYALQQNPTNVTELSVKICKRHRDFSKKKNTSNVIELSEEEEKTPEML